MRRIFSDIPEAITNTINIAKRCSFILEDQAPKLPNIHSGGKNSEINALKEEAYSGLLKKLNIKNFSEKKNDLQYKSRLEYEIKVISEMGYAGYFLIVSDFIGWAKKKIFQ